MNERRTCMNCEAELQAGWQICPVCKTPVRAADAETFFKQAVTLFETENANNKVIELTTEGLEQFPDNAALLTARARSLSAKGEYDKALEDIDDALMLKPDYAFAYRIRGQIYQGMKKNNAALKDYTRAIKFDDKDWYSFHARAALYLNQKQYAESITDYTRAIELDGKNAQYFLDRGIAYGDGGDVDAAIKDFTKSIQLNPELQQALSRRGRIYYFKNDYVQAIKDFNTCLQLQPKDGFSFYWRGRAYLDSGNHDSALDDFNNALRFCDAEYKKDEDIEFYRGQAFFGKKDYKKAIQCFRKAVNQNRGNYNNYVWLGSSYDEAGNHDEARVQYEKSIELYPENGEATHLAQLCNNMGVQYAHLKNKEAAKTCFAKAVELDPNNSLYQDNLNKMNKGCFITTAVCESFGKPDDCYELTEFRNFRDGWLAGQPDGKALATEYYELAPRIVSAINQSPRRSAIYGAIWTDYLAECLRLIEVGQYSECKAWYCKMVRSLQREWIQKE